MRFIWEPTPGWEVRLPDYAVSVVLAGRHAGDRIVRHGGDDPAAPVHQPAAGVLETEILVVEAVLPAILRQIRRVHGVQMQQEGGLGVRVLAGFTEPREAFASIQPVHVELKLRDRLGRVDGLEFFEMQECQVLRFI